VGYIISAQISLIAQHDSSRLRFPALITALCKARGVISDSLTLESLDPAINVAHVKKNCWNLDDLSVTFRGSHKAKGKRSEAPPSFEIPPSLAPAPIPFAPSAFTSVLPAPLSAGPSEFLFTPQVLRSMLQSLHRGQSSIMQSLQGLGLPSIMSMDEFDAQVAWPRAHPSPSRGGGASATQEPAPEEPVAEGEDELTPPEPFYFDVDAHMAQEEETSINQIPESSLAPVPEETQPSTPVMEPEQPIQDSSAAVALDLNEDQPQDEQDV